LWLSNWRIGASNLVQNQDESNPRIVSLDSDSILAETLTLSATYVDFSNKLEVCSQRESEAGSDTCPTQIWMISRLSFVIGAMTFPTVLLSTKFGLSPNSSIVYNARLSTRYSATVQHGQSGKPSRRRWLPNQISRRRCSIEGTVHEFTSSRTFTRVPGTLKSAKLCVSGRTQRIIGSVSSAYWTYTSRRVSVWSIKCIDRGVCGLQGLKWPNQFWESTGSSASRYACSWQSLQLLLQTPFNSPLTTWEYTVVLKL